VVNSSSGKFEGRLAKRLEVMIENSVIKFCDLQSSVDAFAASLRFGLSLWQFPLPIPQSNCVIPEILHILAKKQNHVLQKSRNHLLNFVPQTFAISVPKRLHDVSRKLTVSSGRYCITNRFLYQLEEGQRHVLFC
jgi:hypothetical protein